MVFWKIQLKLLTLRQLIFEKAEKNYFANNSMKQEKNW